MSDSFAEHVRRQWPLRSTHPDFERLREVVELVEGLKGTPEDAKATYDRFIDSYSVAYLGANRMGMNLPHDGQFTTEQLKAIHLLMTNAWAEGAFFGVYFQILGGHREDSAGTP